MTVTSRVEPIYLITVVYKTSLLLGLSTIRFLYLQGHPSSHATRSVMGQNLVGDCRVELRPISRKRVTASLPRPVAEISLW